MSCAIGVASDGEVWLGADSIAMDTGDYSSNVRADKKIFRCGKSKVLMAFIGSFRIGQILMYTEDLFLQRKKIDHEYMVTKFVPKVQEILENNELTLEEEDTNLLVAYKDKLFEIYSDFQVGVSAEKVASIGCAQIALGSLYETSRNRSMHAKVRLIRALEATDCYSAGVRRPFYIANTTDCIIEEIK
jgi:ATP-dependent protease HslVU (ClpYQ) peptidase subunit